MAETDIAKELLKRFDARVSARSNFDARFEEVRRYINSDVDGVTAPGTAGEDRRLEMIDSTAETVSEMAAAAIYSTIANPMTQWLAIRAARSRLNRQHQAARWLDSTSRAVMGRLAEPAARFQVALPRAIRLELDFGTAGIFMGRRPGRPMLYQSPFIGHLYPAENEDGTIDDVHRRARLSARQAVAKFGADKVGRKVAEAHEKGDGETRFDFLHAIMPRREALFTGKLPKDRSPVAEFWVAVDDRQLVGSSGYRRHPLPMARWEHANDDGPYGRGPGLKALPDVKALQRMREDWFDAVEVSIYPPSQVADDGVFGNLNMSARAVNFVRQEFMFGRTGGAIRPIHTGARPDIALEMIQDQRERVGMKYYNHLLSFSRDPRMTATQALILDEESLRVLGPYTGRMQVELLGPVVEYTFYEMLDAGLLEPVPEALDGERLEIEYISTLAKAQQLSEVTALGRLWELFAEMFKLKPEILDNHDLDQAYQHAAARLGYPVELLREEGLVGAIRQARAEAEREAMDAAALESGARAAQSLGQAAGSAQDVGLLPERAAA